MKSKAVKDCESSNLKKTKKNTKLRKTKKNTNRFIHGKIFCSNLLP